jgi:hypothetical protein
MSKVRVLAKDWSLSGFYLRFLPLARHFGFAHNASFTALSREILIMDPRVGFLQPLAERGIRFPMQVTLNERVVAVAAVHALVSSLRG